MNTICNCKECGNLLAVLEESKYIDVKGELVLYMFCSVCSTSNRIPIYEYDKERIAKARNQKEEIKYVNFSNQNKEKKSN